MVTMEIEDKALPIKEDAELKIRPRIFLEGNFFVDLEPGSPSRRRARATAATIPVTQTAAPVQFGDLLTALQSDTRADLQTFLREYSKGLDEGGAEGFNQAIKYWEPAYRNSSLANDATLGQDPDRDLQRVLKGQQKTFGALVRDERALKDLVTNFNVTAGAFAREDVALAASIPALRDTLRVGQPALGVARLGAAVAARLRPRRAAGRALVRRDARGVAAVHHPGAPADVRGRAARDRARAAPDDPGRGGVQPDLGAVPAREPRAVGLHEQRAGAVHAPQDPEPRVGQRGREQQPGGARAASARRSRASPARAASPTATTSSSTPARRRPATACGRARRPTAAACRCRTGPTCPARRRSSRTCTRPAARSRPSRSSSTSPGSDDEAAGSGAADPVELRSTPAQDFVDNVLPLVAKERAAYAAA